MGNFDIDEIHEIRKKHSEITKELSFEKLEELTKKETENIIKEFCDKNKRNLKIAQLAEASVVIVVGSYCFYCYENVCKVSNIADNRYFLTYELTITTTKTNYHKNGLLAFKACNTKEYYNDK